MSTFSLDDMVGKIATKVYENQYGDELTFEFEDGTKCNFFHYQDCCESVSIEDVNGDYEDLVGTPLLVAEERGWEPEDYKPSDWGDVNAVLWQYHGE